LRTRMSQPRPHVSARGPWPHYPARFSVPDERVPWETDWPEYVPTRFTAPHVLQASWADAADPVSVDWSTRVSYEGPLRFNGPLPLNPFGRTGMAERGYLGKWGANHAADPIVTRFDPSTGRLQVVAIVRRDNGMIALPGGMVDAGEKVSATVRREFEEEAVNLPNEQARADASALLERLFSGAAGASPLYRGYVDDPRNTDHAWLETQAFHFHCEGAVARLNLAAGDDAAHAFWLDCDASNAHYQSFFPSHKVWVELAASTLRNADLLKNMRRPKPANVS